MEKHVRTLRAWHLALLRFAVTMDNADRLAVLMVAAEIDKLGATDATTSFGFFRNTSSELCAAILQPTASAPAVLRQFLARIDDERLKRAFVAALEIDPPAPASAAVSARRDNNLWRGLGTRRSHAPQEEI